MPVGAEELLFADCRPTGGRWDAWPALVCSNDHRPANSMLVTVLCRRFRSKSANGARFYEGINNARRPSKLSAVTRPCVTSSPSACSTREGNRRVCRTISLKNKAPAWVSVLNTKSVSGESATCNTGLRGHEGGGCERWCGTGATDPRTLTRRRGRRKGALEKRARRCEGQSRGRGGG